MKGLRIVGRSLPQAKRCRRPFGALSPHSTWHTGSLGVRRQRRRLAATPLSDPGFRVAVLPGRGELRVRFGRAVKGEVEVSLLSAQGREVARLPVGAGQRRVEWRYRPGAAGVYVLKVTAGGARYTVPVLVVR